MTNKLLFINSLPIQLKEISLTSYNILDEYGILILIIMLHTSKSYLQDIVKLFVLLRHIRQLVANVSFSKE